MNFSQDAVRSLLNDMWAFAPELILCAGIVLMLILKLGRGTERLHLGGFALATALCALIWSYVQWHNVGLPNVPSSRECFSGFLVLDNLTLYLRLFLLAFIACINLLTMLTRIPDSE